MSNIKFKELLSKSTVEDIILCPSGLYFFERGSWKGPFESTFTKKMQLQSIARQIAEEACLQLGPTQPSADSFLNVDEKTKFRAHVVIPPMVSEGPHITLRRLNLVQSFDIHDFTKSNKIINQLRLAVQNEKSILIAGATGSGKSSLICSFFQEIQENSRVIILEDSPELPVPNKISTKLLARNDRFGFRNGANWDLCHLLFESLRMRPDRLILGECRGPEALAIANALQTGHKGLMTTIHAGSCIEALNRFHELAKTASQQKTRDFKKSWDLCVHVELCKKTHQRKIKEVLETKNAF